MVTGYRWVLGRDFVVVYNSQLLSVRSSEVLNRVDAGMQECRNDIQLRCGEESEVM